MRFLFAVTVVLCLASLAVAASVDTAVNHLAKNDFGAAIIELEAYVTEKPEDSQGIFLLGYAYYKAGRMDEAMNQFRSAYLLDPDFTPTVPPRPADR